MEEIICYTPYLLEGERRNISFLELLLDDNWANGYIECPEDVYFNIGDINHRLVAKQNYEFLLRAVQKYPLKAMGGVHSSYEGKHLGVGKNIWEEYRTDCYVLGKYKEELIASGYYSDAVKELIAKALDFPDSGEAVIWLNKMISHAAEYYAIDDDTRPFLIYQDNDFCCHVPASFANGLAEALRTYRQQVFLWDVANETGLAQFAGQRFKAVIGIQTYIFLSTTQKGYLHDLIGGPKYNIILDHPIGLRNLFENHPDHYYVMVHDRNYQRFLKHYWPNVEECYCFSPGGMFPAEPMLKWETSGRCINWAEVKQYDVVFIGSYPDYRNFLELMYGLHGPYRILAAYFLHVMRWNPNYPAEKALNEALEYYGISIGNADFLNLLEMLRYVISCVSSYYREKIICSLLDEGIEIHVYGDNWCNAPFSLHKCLVCHPAINMEDSLHIMERAKISLNVMTWHKDGFTERVLNSMLAGAAVLSDKSRAVSETQ